ncbi:hypothetical protein FT663_03506 [Candidozyma haemuli var. vulneris]|nr:hypothetical protein FT662_03679 [[Candida] haemuloni var. vulneris]KAF3989737.1 hypothetical protein FT663_03506 [[Candida] haemuloni var. vulneris]
MYPLIKRNAQIVAAPLVFLFQLLNRIFWSGLNERSIFTMPLNFCVNFSPVFIWLLIFKNAGLIPKEIRPLIHVSLAHHVDDIVFDVWGNPVTSILSLAALKLSAWGLYVWFFSKRGSETIESTACSSMSPSSQPALELSVFDEEEDFDLNKSTQGEDCVPSGFQSHPRIGSLPFFPKLTQHDAALNARAINRELWHHMNEEGAPTPFNCWQLTPPILLGASWILLNIDSSLAKNITETKDTIAWLSYVIGHFCVPLFTAIWLYVFHAPGALKCFGFALGAQNIAGVLTHLSFPNAPPWFIHKYGDDAHADYDTLGYAAGLTRAKFSTGTFMVNNGFHKSPIVFGALPSLHSAMAVMCFFFVCYYSRWISAKMLLFAFVFCQWWATIYLDHHWRLDLLVGLMYAIVSYTIFSKWLMPRVDHEFAQARLRYDFSKGSTMGMRVFRNTKIQNFFDPMA